MDPTDPDPQHCFATSFDFLPLKNDVKVPSKVISTKTCLKKFVSCWHLEGQG
jgi:hypothetical protein